MVRLARFVRIYIMMFKQSTSQFAAKQAIVPSRHGQLIAVCIIIIGDKMKTL